MLQSVHNCGENIGGKLLEVTLFAPDFSEMYRRMYLIYLLINVTDLRTVLVLSRNK